LIPILALKLPQILLEHPTVAATAPGDDDEGAAVDNEGAAGVDDRGAGDERNEDSENE
jgi:hypothetical protein